VTPGESPGSRQGSTDAVALRIEDSPVAARACRPALLPECSAQMKQRSVRLFVKSGCGWCEEAQEWLDRRQIPHQVVNVSASRAAFDEMRQLSGQTLAPVIDVDGDILADFDTDQLAAFWKELEKSGH
jgi:glutaredoxin 3